MINSKKIISEIHGVIIVLKSARDTVTQETERVKSMSSKLRYEYDQTIKSYDFKIEGARLIIDHLVMMKLIPKSNRREDT